MTKIVLVGYFLEIEELCDEETYIIEGVIEPERGNYKFAYLGDDSRASELFKNYGTVPIIIVPDQPRVRARLCNLYSKFGYSNINLISHSAHISKSAVIDNGIIIQSGVNISSRVSIDSFVKLNVGCNIMHDVIIKEYATIAPNAVVLGRATIGIGCYIGANSTILPGVEIGDWSIVGAGSVVTKNVPANTIVKGVPAV